MGDTELRTFLVFQLIFSWCPLYYQFLGSREQLTTLNFLKYLRNYSTLVISLKIMYFEFHDGVSKLTEIKLLRSPLNKTAIFKIKDENVRCIEILEAI